MKKGINVIDEIMSGLLPEWDNLTKARYLYLKSCEYFTYDERYTLLNGDLKFDYANELNNKKFDLTNVTDNRVLCKTWSREVYKKLLDEANIPSEIMGEGRAHQFIKLQANGYDIVADATILSDLSRAKMKLDTKCFYSQNKNGILLTAPELKDIDKKIGYITYDYSNDQIKSMIASFTDSIDDSSIGSLFISNKQREIILDKMYAIKNIVETFDDITSYYDLKFAVGYVQRKIFNNDEIRELFKEKELFNLDQNDFTTIYKIGSNRIDNIGNFIITNPGDGYCFYEATNSQVKKIEKSYSK